MGDPFDAAAGTLFGAPGFGVTATYTPSGGSATSVRVIEHNAVELEAALGSLGIQRPAKRFDLRVSEVATRPTNGATLKVGTPTYTVRKAEIDEAGVTWVLDVDSV